MGQVNVNPGGYEPPVNDGSRAAVANNLTWAIAVVLIIAALAVAIVYVVHNVHP
jgi:hypothetical protein